MSITARDAAGRAAEIDRIVVERVFEHCQRYIAAAVCGFAIRAEFLGALAANESGGIPGAAHFEAWVYERLKAVASGESAAFGSIGRNELVSALGVTSPSTGAAANDAADRQLREFATSWGFTQIMGYHVISRKLPINVLLEPPSHFQLAVELLARFARRFHLRAAADCEPLFRCWNTGRPDGSTSNPDYVAAGMRRMVLYREIAANSSPPPSLVPRRAGGSGE